MINGRGTDHILLATLGKNWWMVGIRGVLAILFGLTILLRPGLSLKETRGSRSASWPDSASSALVSAQP
ncbi:MAG TPA: hypothetical protein VNC82_09620 [Candidatus Limnocylindria bacterium]|nr:hypothetical protein [Candidatus Limnocylindria bacterium]